MTRTRRTAAIRVALLTAVTCLSLTGCGSAADRDTGRQVASIGSSPAGSATTSQDANSSTTTGSSTASGTTGTRPRDKLFQTDQEAQANLVPYTNCMRAHGVEVGAYGKPSGDLENYQAADSACADQRPLPPIEEDSSNPHALEFNRAVAACLRAHGARYVDVTVDGAYVRITLGGDSNDSQSISVGMQYTTACQREVSQHHQATAVTPPTARQTLTTTIRMSAAGYSAAPSPFWTRRSAPDSRRQQRVTAPGVMDYCRSCGADEQRRWPA